MRLFIIAFSFLFSLRCFSQEPGGKFYFKQVGWTMALPPDFKIADSSYNAAMTAKGAHEIKEATNVQADVSEMKTLITATKNRFNYVNATITPFDPKVDGNYDLAEDSVKQILYATFLAKAPNAKIDSASTTETIDGLVFDKFQIVLSMGSRKLFTMCILCKFYKGYDFGISYLYMDEGTGKDIESVLKESTFEK